MQLFCTLILCEDVIVRMKFILEEIKQFAELVLTCTRIGTGKTLARRDRGIN